MLPTKIKCHNQFCRSKDWSKTHFAVLLTLILESTAQNTFAAAKEKKSTLERLKLAQMILPSFVNETNESKKPCTYTSKNCAKGMFVLGNDWLGNNDFLLKWETLQYKP